MLTADYEYVAKCFKLSTDEPPEVLSDLTYDVLSKKFNHFSQYGQYSGVWFYYFFSMIRDFTSKQFMKKDPTQTCPT